MRRISSADNPIWKATARLVRKKERDRSGTYLIEGFHLLEEALKSNVMPETVLIKESLPIEEWEGLEACLGEWEALGTTVCLVEDPLFQKIADTQTPQGVLSAVKKKQWTGPEFFSSVFPQAAGNILVLDRLQDPGNLGTLIRTADAAGWQGVMILKGTADIYSPKVVRSASGSLFRLPVLFVEGPEDALALLREAEKRILVTTPHCDTYYYDVDMRENIALVIGNEGEGISKAFLTKGDISVKLPMAGTVESLNAAVAAGILMYESLRQGKQNRNKGE